MGRMTDRWRELKVVVIDARDAIVDARRAVGELDEDTIDATGRLAEILRAGSSRTEGLGRTTGGRGAGAGSRGVRGSHASRELESLRAGHGSRALVGVRGRISVQDDDTVAELRGLRADIRHGRGGLL